MKPIGLSNSAGEFHVGFTTAYAVKIAAVAMPVCIKALRIFRLLVDLRPSKPIGNL
jgi:hypothetical protein